MIREVPVTAAAMMLNQPNPPQLLDCREPWEFFHVHLDFAVNIPLNELAMRADELDPERPVLVICHHGVRSLTAAMILDARGYEAISVAGGIDAWSTQVDPSLRRY